MKRGVVVWVLLGACSGAWGAAVAPSGDEGVPAGIVSREEVRFFLNEARRAIEAMAKGESYVPEPAVASRAKAIAERLRAQGVGLLEQLLEQAEREWLKARPADPDLPPAAVEPPPARTRA